MGKEEGANADFSKFDGLEAVNKMNAGSKYDLVLMDIIMPNLDGVSACHLISQFDSTPIIAMTSNIRSDDIAMYFQHGTIRLDLFFGWSVADSG